MPRSAGAWKRSLTPFDVRPHERRALGWALLYVFAVLSAYYVLRPIRDEMGVLNIRVGDVCGDVLWCVAGRTVRL